MPWLDAAGPDPGSFAIGLQQEDAVLRATIAEPWSTGPIEGVVDRLNLLRQPVLKAG